LREVDPTVTVEVAAPNAEHVAGRSMGRRVGKTVRTVQEKLQALLPGDTHEIGKLVAIDATSYRRKAGK